MHPKPKKNNLNPKPRARSERDTSACGKRVLALYQKIPLVQNATANVAAKAAKAAEEKAEAGGTKKRAAAESAATEEAVVKKEDATTKAKGPATTPSPTSKGLSPEDLRALELARSLAKDGSAVQFLHGRLVVAGGGNAGKVCKLTKPA